MTGARPILVVDDDQVIRRTLAEQLQLDGEFQVLEAATLAEARQKLKEPDARCDAILLDVTLPDGDGRDFCAELRKDGLRMPVIMLTGSIANALPYTAWLYWHCLAHYPCCPYYGNKLRLLLPHKACLCLKA